MAMDGDGGLAAAAAPLPLDACWRWVPPPPTAPQSRPYEGLEQVSGQDCSLDGALAFLWIVFYKEAIQIGVVAAVFVSPPLLNRV